MEKEKKSKPKRMFKLLNGSLSLPDKHPTHLPSVLGALELSYKKSSDLQGTSQSEFTPVDRMLL